MGEMRKIHPVTCEEMRKTATKQRGDGAMRDVEWLGKAGKTKVVPGTFYAVTSPADDYVERMDNADTLFRKVLAAEFAIRADPGCVEAHLFMGSQLRDATAAMRHLEQAVAAGEALWAPVAAAEGEDMVWWGCTATRPYMRAIHSLGLAHREAGNEEDARVCFDRLLGMNPNDNQGIRYLMDDVGTVSAPSM
jgi:tetratricopeptide (TPR) repeat protein